MPRTFRGGVIVAMALLLIVATTSGTASAAEQPTGVMAQFEDRSVRLFDPLGGRWDRPSAELTLPCAVGAPAYDAKALRVYGLVRGCGPGTAEAGLLTLDARTGERLSLVALSRVLHGVAFAHYDGGALWAVSHANGGTNTLFRIDVATGEVAQGQACPGVKLFLQSAGYGSRLVVAGTADGWYQREWRWCVFELGRGAPAVATSLAGEPARMLQFDPASGRLFGLAPSGQNGGILFAEVDPATGRTLRSHPFPREVGGLPSNWVHHQSAITPDGKRFITGVTASTRPRLAIVDTATGRVESLREVGYAAGGDGLGTRLFLSGVAPAPPTATPRPATATPRATATRPPSVPSPRTTASATASPRATASPARPTPTTRPALQGRVKYTTRSVGIVNGRFAPASIVVPRGTEVQWRNADKLEHVVADVGGRFASDRLPPGWLKRDAATFAYTFATSGRYQIFCEVHPRMRAMVTVR